MANKPVKCKKCGARVRNVFGSKLSHVLMAHQDVVIEEMVTTGGESIRDRAFELGKQLRERFTHEKLDTVNR